MTKQKSINNNKKRTNTMKRKLQLLTGIGCLCLCFLSCSQPPYKNPALSPEERANDLVGRLTLEEKAALMQNTSPAIPRLGIKAYDWWNEALHGVGRAGLATVFPQAIGMGASFNNELLYDVFTAISDEARAKNTEFSKEGGLKRYQGLTMWTPTSSVIRVGDGGKKLTEKTLTSPARWVWQWYAVCKVLRGKNMTSCMPAPSTMPYIPVRNGTAIVSMPKTSTRVIFGKPICLLLKTWFKKRM